MTSDERYIISENEEEIARLQYELSGAQMEIARSRKAAYAMASALSIYSRYYHFKQFPHLLYGYKPSGATKTDLIALDLLDRYYPDTFPFPTKRHDYRPSSDLDGSPCAFCRGRPDDHDEYAHEEFPALRAPNAEALGRQVRETWIQWAKTQPDVAEHPSWLVPWEELPERDKQVDRFIGIAVINAYLADQ